MYLLPQMGVQNRLFCLRHWIHVCKYDIAVHVMQFFERSRGQIVGFCPRG